MPDWHEGEWAPFGHERDILAGRLTVPERPMVALTEGLKQPEAEANSDRPLKAATTPSCSMAETVFPECGN